MSKVLVFTETSHGKVKKSSLELLTVAKKSGQSVVALAVGSEATAAAQEIANYGAAEVYLLGSSDFDKYNPELFAAGICDVIQKSGATTVLAPSSSAGRDVFPRVGARLSAGVVSDCTELTLSGDLVTVKKPIYSGKVVSTVSFENSPIKIILMRANQLPIGEPTSGAQAKIINHAFEKPSLSTIIKEVVKGASEKLDLTEANIIVSGGRGLKEAGNFKLLNELAEVLGATVGASRAVVDAGWVSHEMQVGQTGKTVAPSLYIAVGISGAIQHLAGMSSSKVIVAINTDPNAPIFQKATYGIVGDFADVVPKLTAEFKKALH
jgi:electron transfer flavoprotein alpha subunit